MQACTRCDATTGQIITKLTQSPIAIICGRIVILGRIEAVVPESRSGSTVREGPTCLACGKVVNQSFFRMFRRQKGVKWAIFGQKSSLWTLFVRRFSITTSIFEKEHGFLLCYVVIVPLSPIITDFLGQSRDFQPFSSFLRLSTGGPRASPPGPAFRVTRRVAPISNTYSTTVLLPRTLLFSFFEASRRAVFYSIRQNRQQTPRFAYAGKLASRGSSLMPLISFPTAQR